MNRPLSIEPYANRPTWPIEVRDFHGWALKVYGIRAGVPGVASLPPSVQAAAVDHLSGFLEQNPSVVDPDHERNGFAIIHQGSEAVWLLLDLWRDDILHQFLWSAPLSAPTEFREAEMRGNPVCVWEIEVVKHERDAWVEHVLSRPSSPDYHGYLGERLRINA